MILGSVLDILALGFSSLALCSRFNGLDPLVEAGLFLKVRGKSSTSVSVSLDRMPWSIKEEPLGRS